MLAYVLVIITKRQYRYLSLFPTRRFLFRYPQIRLALCVCVHRHQRFLLPGPTSVAVNHRFHSQIHCRYRTIDAALNVSPLRSVSFDDLTKDHEINPLNYKENTNDLEFL